MSAPLAAAVEPVLNVAIEKRSPVPVYVQISDAILHEFEAVVAGLIFGGFTFGELFFGSRFGFGSVAAIPIIEPIGHILRGWIFAKSICMTIRSHQKQG